MTQDELETHLQAVALPYRDLWLTDAFVLAQVEQILSDALGCKSDPSAGGTAVPLDALALAEAAAYKLRELGQVTRHRRPTRQARRRAYA